MLVGASRHTDHVFNTLFTGDVHHFDLVSITLVNPVFLQQIIKVENNQDYSYTCLSIVVNKLDLSRIRELHNCSDRQIKFSALCVIVPHMLSL